MVTLPPVVSSPLGVATWLPLVPSNSDLFGLPLAFQAAGGLTHFQISNLGVAILR